MTAEYPAEYLVLSEMDKQMMDSLTREEISRWEAYLSKVIASAKEAGQPDDYPVVIRCKKMQEYLIVRTGQLMAEQLANPNKRA